MVNKSAAMMLNTTQIHSIIQEVNDSCHLPFHQEITKFVITLFVNICGIILAILSIIFASINNSIDPSLRGILLSFSLANFLGTFMLTYDTIMTICFRNTTSVGVVISISISLTMGHMIFLLLAEYLILTSVVRRSVKDFSGLLIVTWIISICIGTTMVITSNKEGRIAFVAIIVIIILCMIFGYASIIKKSQRRVKALEAYEKAYLNLYHHKSRVVKRYWKLRYYAIILISYVVCVTPWVIEEVYEGVKIGSDHVMVESIPLIIYAVNFYIPSGIIIYLWKKKYKAKKRADKLYAFARKSLMIGMRCEIRRIHDMN